VVSAGFAIGAEHPLRPEISAEQEWQQWMQGYPALAEVFSAAEIVEVPGKLIRTGRLQRCIACAAQHDWAALPHTAGFIDPLHSTGIAHSLCGIERLAQILEKHWHRDSLAAALREYNDTVLNEIRVIDRIVHGCYVATPSFRLFAAYCMLYFISAVTYERRRRERGHEAGPFLCAGDEDLQTCLTAAHDAIQQLVSRPHGLRDEEEFVTQLRELIAPFNRVGLLDPACRNMYRDTAAR
jgi:FADH2 O2-dependent halogenase